jgi:hypothetical protein
LFQAFLSGAAPTTAVSIQGNISCADASVRLPTAEV